ncbi:MFS transporter, DHA1 family, bicyclomycin/chloramphenicol resistance protein [Aureimonas altamirensis DSM 21988]|uniref:Bcr/CflA family efflux transporter n=1 Tax=Aureimonas altamirensis DSM 21988 TaxID=1121026 RepID=A0ABY1IDP8_9HYPH|nr:multidrug effflux MFS transporter [Aureimonas altamirensis]SHJ02740.1 MFS transporter, DHA1 family, bicyclomycin/chloramphenicol resistance protein [Aureimonas altamirensis DSM 21988]
MKGRMSEARTSVIGALLVAIGPISMALYTPAMPELVRAFGTDPALVKLSLTLYFAGFAVTQLVCGPLSDALGRRRTTVIFMILYIAGALVAVLAPTIGWLLAARLLQGVGASVGVATARAIVRDQFTGEASSRIMSTIGMILALGPAIAPTIGGFTLALAGWHAIFVVMLFFGIAVIGIVLGAMRETTTPNPAMLQPRAILSAYGELISSRTFLCCCLVLGGSVGALYTWATILPFVLIDHAGLTPQQFGIGMLAQSGMFFLGSSLTRLSMRWMPAERLVAPGLFAIGLGGLLLLLVLSLRAPGYIEVMIPIGLYAFGIGFVMPAMTTAALAPFPGIAGSAAAMMGFMQMGAGLLGGLIAAAIPDPVLAVRTIIPAFACVAIAAYLALRSPSATPPAVRR